MSSKYYQNKNSRQKYLKQRQESLLSADFLVLMFSQPLLSLFNDLLLLLLLSLFLLLNFKVTNINNGVYAQNVLTLLSL